MFRITNYTHIEQIKCKGNTILVQYLMFIWIDGNIKIDGKILYLYVWFVIYLRNLRKCTIENKKKVIANYFLQLNYWKYYPKNRNLVAINELFYIWYDLIMAKCINITTFYWSSNRSYMTSLIHSLFAVICESTST